MGVLASYSDENGAGETIAYGLYPTLGFRCSTSVCWHRASSLADVASSCYL